MKKDVIVIGAGASGIIAAIKAASEGAKVMLLDGNNKVGKKLYATGNGRCNFTNLNMEKNCFRSDSGDEFYKVIDAFNENEVISFFYRMGINHKDRNGYVYPTNDQAASVVAAFENALRHFNVSVKLNERCENISFPGDCIRIKTPEGEYKADSVVIACGLKAYPNMGSDGNLFPVLKRIGYRFEEVTPALVPLIYKHKFLSKAAGVRCNGRITLYIDGEYVCADTGELQFNKTNISGIPTFQVSRYASKAIYEEKKVSVKLDLYPFSNRKDFIKELLDKKKILGYESVTDVLNGMLNNKLTDVILKTSGTRGEREFGEFSQADIDKIADVIKNFEVTVTDTAGFDAAQVCAGGIKLSEIDLNTMESKRHKGLFFCGEILDVDGICGGYNLQWAWSGGYLAGMNAACKGDI
ncbi:MAG: NAD(P)/FAD-dependent oxidoreductase [Lachnospiraceae bacterium]|nr:NAD(P)/FAD-dependent oxidoreductase [Lachnospiraceae bacterium]